MVKTELESRGILTWIRPLGIPGYPCLVGWLARAWGVVQVPRDDLEVATEIVADLMTPIRPRGEDLGW